MEHLNNSHCFQNENLRNVDVYFTTSFQDMAKTTGKSLSPDPSLFLKCWKKLNNNSIKKILLFTHRGDG